LVSARRALGLRRAPLVELLVGNALSPSPSLEKLERVIGIEPTTFSLGS
jgi:hypothetical protein